LKAKPGSTIIYNLISSQAVPEIVAESGGISVRSRVGHSYIKKLMAETGAIFGGEHSGHFYFADFWKADSGMLAALYALTELSASDKKLSELLQPFNRYLASGEINTTVADTHAALQRITSNYGATHAIDDLDGLTVQGQDYWFNVRPSNTEPLLRLNVEAQNADLLARITAEVQGVISAL
jgi:phosphomannomutase